MQIKKLLDNSSNEDVTDMDTAEIYAMNRRKRNPSIVRLRPISKSNSRELATVCYVITQLGIIRYELN